ncbi:MAG: response regulator [Candidatus Sumerlaeia bacterium]|nr:response regulator [Candidatus Sumerlaeia bacterium]
MAQLEQEVLKGQVLVVEDNPVILQVLSFALERCGLGATAWDNPLEALEYYRNNKDAISIVVTDIDMPGINGFELCNEILAENPDMAFIFISGAPFCDRLDADAHLERFPFLSKPFRISHFLEVLSNEMGIETVTPNPTSS